jgi:hypothetical protein
LVYFASECRFGLLHPGLFIPFTKVSKKWNEISQLCNPRYSGGRDRRIRSSRPAQEKLADPVSKTKYKEKDIVQVIELDVIVCTCNSSTWEAEAGGLKVGGQPELHSEKEIE